MRSISAAPSFRVPAASPWRAPERQPFFSGTNTYNGNTAVNAGTLYADGTGSTSGGAVNVASGATLAGKGTLIPNSSTAVNVANGGNITPGDIQTVGTAPNGSLTLNISQLITGNVMTVTGANPATPGTGPASLTFALGTGGTSSQIDIASSSPSTTNRIFFNNDPTVSILDLTSGQLILNHDYTLIQGDAGTVYQGLSTTLIAPGVSLITGGLTLLTPTGGNTFSQYYPTSQLYLIGNNIEVDVVPEPSTWAALLLGGIALLVVHQRRKRAL